MPVKTVLVRVLVHFSVFRPGDCLQLAPEYADTLLTRKMVEVVPIREPELTEIAVTPSAPVKEEPAASPLLDRLTKLKGRK